MAEQQRYRVVGDNHYHDGERLRTGDVFTPTESELAAFGHKFEPVDDDEDEDAEGEAEVEPEPEPEPEGGDEDEYEADAEADEDEEICGEEMSSGDICQRPASSCPYHGG